ncbi:unnamed protein product [Oreochromis niloticus]|nr:unnamed protein product [Mustela putorius furo]
MQKPQKRQDGTSWSHSGSTNTWKEEPTVQTQGHRKECSESSREVKNTTEKMPSDLSWDTWIMELLDQENEWEHVFNSVVKHLGGGKIMENKIQSTDCFRFPYTGNSCCICNSVHPEESPHSTTDPWLTYNDTQVLHTTGSAACEEQQHSAYILFYKRNTPFSFIISSLTTAVELDGG